MCLKNAKECVMLYTGDKMKYENIVCGEFIDRPNRFIANVMIDSKPYVCHVKNTGRCKELLIKGCKVYLEKSGNPERKTLYDLVAVKKGERLINMDSQAPNKAAFEWLVNKKPFGEGWRVLAEKSYKKSRFDFMLEHESGRKMYLEVKGCTLEENGVVMFPDAPTQRGLRHIGELIECIKDGYEAVLLILVQMKDVKYFTPNYATHKEFGDAMKLASEKGVKLLCYDCLVAPDSMVVDREVEIVL